MPREGAKRGRQEKGCEIEMVRKRTREIEKEIERERERERKRERRTVEKARQRKGLESWERERELLLNLFRHSSLFIKTLFCLVVYCS